MLLSTLLVLAQAAVTFVVPSVSATSVQRRASDCNGDSSLCAKGYGSVTFVGSHDSYAIGTNNLAANQDQSIETQLNDGIRMLQIQVHNQNGELRTCHTSCSLLDGGSLTDYLGKVKSWMDQNPNNVVTILIVNSDNRPASEYDSVYKSAGLDSRSFSPSSSPLAASDWPTLGSMIDAKTTLVSFLDNGADSSVPYLIDEFPNMWETKFNVVNTADFDCSVNRSKGDAGTSLFLINHFLDQVILGQPAPLPEKANVTNSAGGDGSLGDHINACKSTQNRAPNFLLLDFYEYAGGAPFQLAAGINGVQYNPSNPIASPATSSSSSSASSTGSPSGERRNTSPFTMRRQWVTLAAVLCGSAVGVFSVV